MIALNSRSIQYVCAICEERSFSKAAKNLFISQPSLSAHIKKLEAELGVPIFERSTIPLRLTSAGEVCIETMRKIQALEEELETYLRDYNNLNIGTLSIGAASFFASFLLPSLISQFSQKFPGVQVNLFEGNTPVLEQQALDNAVDLIIDFTGFNPEFFVLYPMMDEHVLLAVPSGAAVNERLTQYALDVDDIARGKHLDPTHPAAPLREFQNETFLFLQKGHDMFFRATRICAENGLEPNVSMYLSQLMTIYNLTNQQFGVSFVSDTVVRMARPAWNSPNVVFYRIDSPLATRQVFLVHKKNRYLSRAAQEFIALARESLQTIGTAKKL